MNCLVKEEMYQNC